MRSQATRVLPLSLVAALGLLYEVSTPSTTLASSDLVGAALVGSTAECGLCDGGCFTNGVLGHTFKVDNNGTAFAGSMGTHECDAGSCDDEHPTGCGGGGGTFTAVPTAELWNELHRANGADLRQLLREPSGRVIVNRARSAFQLRSCDGALIAHLPMTPGQARALLE